ncbi:MAG: phenylalanine--tRNA ligase subunit beta [Chloroflexi bacterium]|nr:phenylalanine--tRNA ligase subunit beta [Chloroflexota bacterium]
MRVPLGWLREYIDLPASADDIAERLTMSGTEVANVIRVGSEWDRVVIGQVQTITPHEHADNLFVARVNLAREQVTLVTAASNVRAGDVVSVVRAGGRLAAGPRVEARSFRGVQSNGMLCSGDELGISPEKQTIYVLEADAPIGANLRDYLGDEVLDIELTPNRPDCLGIVGIAREVAALFGAELRMPHVDQPNDGRPAGDVVRVFVDDPDLCPRYTAGYVNGVRIVPSPQWLQRRLHLAGIRSISNVVDATNYVMLELGQPLHAFDADRLQARTIRVRRARANERLTTIDGVERVLPTDALVIADAETPAALAGIMGGSNTEISEGTRRILLESATFDRMSVRQTSRALRLVTEASKRFDKGLDEELPPFASRRALALIRELAGGSVAEGLVDVWRPRDALRTIAFTADDLAALIGNAYAAEQIEDVLRPLGFALERDGERTTAIVPSWRDDVTDKADIAEEVARVTGYDAIPTTLPRGELPSPADDPGLRWREVVRSALAGAGLQEVMTYSLIDPYAVSKLDAGAPFPATGPDEGTIPIHNPMTIDRSRLRTTLLPSLFATVAANLRYQNRVLLFEIAHVFLPPLEPLPREEQRLAIAMAGRRSPPTWNADTAPIDFYDLKAAVEAAFRILHVPLILADAANVPWLHPGRSAVLRTTGDDRELGHLGQVHPRVAERFEMEGMEIYAAELDLDALMSLAAEEIRVRPLLRYPAVERDLAIIVDGRVSHERVAAAVQAAAGPLLEQITLFDVYQGAPVPEGHRSLAYSLSFRSPERTLADDEVATAMAAIEHAVTAQLAAHVRGR